MCEHCSASILEVPAKRTWTVYYPGAEPGSRTRTWGFLQAENKVLHHCLAWAWKHHAKTGEKCPWTFEV
eukprot:4891101-Pyramimonas_sp.AAC.1